MESVNYVPVSNDLNDKNSLYSAISILLFGDEMNYKHIRLSIVYMFFKNEEYKKKFKDQKIFESLVEKIVKTGFHSEFDFPVVANLLDRTLKVYKWENYTEPPQIYQPGLLHNKTENVNNRDPVIVVKKNNNFIPLLNKEN